jgi:hypothetical protein
MCHPDNQRVLARSIRHSVLIEYDGDHDASLKNPSLLESHLDLLFA